MYFISNFLQRVNQSINNWIITNYQSKWEDNQYIYLQDNCSYTVLIETTCTKGAGTRGNVSLRFGDSRSTDILTPRLLTRHAKTPDEAHPATVDDVPSIPFQQCAIVTFSVTGKCVQSQICYLYLKHRGKDSWRPGRVQVTVSESPELSSDSFYFRRVLPRGLWHGHDLCRGQVTPFGIRQARKVFAPNHGLKSPQKLCSLRIVLIFSVV